MTQRGAAPGKAAGDAAPRDGRAAEVVRRAPFADNPTVGERGQRTQAAILEAALDVFGEVGYHGCGVQQITARSGCSRVSFYQYFSSKEDLFRQLAGRVARELTASADAIGAITPDESGWRELHDWLGRYARIYCANEAVFVAYQSAAAADEEVARGSAKLAVRGVAALRSRVEGSALAPGAIDSVVRVLQSSLVPANRMLTLLEAATPGARGWRRDQLHVALADVVHRTLFAPVAGVNVRPPRRSRRAAIALDVVSKDEAEPGTLGPGATQTRDQLLQAARTVFSDRGFYATRVADIVAAAAVSHGLFYRYFSNKTDIFEVLASRAVRRVEGAFEGLPTDSYASLRHWLRHFAETYSEETAITAMWIDAMSRGQDLTAASTSAIEAGRQVLARALADRGYGDADTEAVVLLVLLFAMVERRATAARVDAFATVIERGLLTPPGALVSARERRRPR